MDNIEIVLLSPNSKLPVRSTIGSVGYDIYASDCAEVMPHARKLISTGLTINFPSDVWARISPRSGLSVKSCIDIGAGIIDSDYRGEIKVLIINNGDNSFPIKIGDRIAQLIFEKRYDVNLIESTLITNTSRNEKGFGSTGK